MNNAVNFDTKIVSCCHYSCYAKAADSVGKYYPWDNLQFKTKEEGALHLKNEKHENPDWYDRLVLVKVQLEIVG